MINVKNRYGHMSKIAVYKLVRDIEQEAGEWC
jgi:hypothetical protein